MYQNNLEEYRKWLEAHQAARQEEAEKLSRELRMAEAKIRKASEHLAEAKSTKLSYLQRNREYTVEEARWVVLPIDPRSEVEKAERIYELAWEWYWRLKRRLRDLIKDERDDLRHLETLETRQRFKERRLQRIRSANGQPENGGTGNRTKRNRQHKKVRHLRTDVQGKKT